MNSQIHPALAADPDQRPTGAGLVGRLTIDRHADPRAVEGEWRMLEKTGVGTVFQRFDWVDAYARHVLPRESARPAILLGRLDGQPAFVLPLAVGPLGPARCATWIGGVHSGYNFGLWSREAAALLHRMPAPDLHRLLAGALDGVDGAVLKRMPLVHDGVELPLANLNRLASPTSGYSFQLQGDFNAVLARRGNAGQRRRKMRYKEQKMAASGPLEWGTLADPAEAHAALDFFAEQKALRLAEQRIPNSFAEPGVMDFFHDLIDRSTHAREPLLEMARIEVGGKTRAVSGSGLHCGRTNVYFMTYTRDELLQHSPGQTLTFHHIEECCARGLAAYDLGVGYESYKASWCDVEHALTDGYAPFTTLGAAAIGTLKLIEQTKISLRRNEALWARLKSLQNRLRRVRQA